MSDVFLTDGDDYILVTQEIGVTYYGLGGHDTLDFSNIGAGIEQVSLGVDAAFVSSGIEVDYYSFETVIGTPFDDKFEGLEIGEVLMGGAGDDTFVLGAGDDRLVGGDGNDTLLLLDNSTTIPTTSGAYVNLAAGIAESAGFITRLVSIETVNAHSFQEYDDTLIGDGFGNTLEGWGGDDTIAGAGGADTLRGEMGDDTIDGGSGDDLLEAGDGNDVLKGGSGNDVLEGGAGSDSLDGGAGIDTASYAGAGAVIVRLASGTASGDGSDMLSAIENATGGAFDDRLFGNAQANALKGGAGDDRLSGGASTDTLDGGLGKDKLAGGAGNDTFGFTTVLGSSNIDTVVGFAAGDSIVLSRAIFGALGLGQLSASAFSLNGPTGLAAQIVYNQATGYLLYDTNGAAAGGSTRFALVSGAPTLDNTLFTVV